MYGTRENQDPPVDVDGMGRYFFFINTNKYTKLRFCLLVFLIRL